MACTNITKKVTIDALAESDIAKKCKETEVLEVEANLGTSARIVGMAFCKLKADRQLQLRESGIFVA